MATGARKEIHSLTADQTVLDEILYAQVTDLLTAHTETQQLKRENPSVPDFALSGTLEAQYQTLCNQMAALTEESLRNDGIDCNSLSLLASYCHCRVSD